MFILINYELIEIACVGIFLNTAGCFLFALVVIRLACAIGAAILAVGIALALAGTILFAAAVICAVAVGAAFAVLVTLTVTGTVSRTVTIVIGKCCFFGDRLTE